MQSCLAGFEKAAAKAEEMVIEQCGKRKERWALLDLSSMPDHPCDCVSFFLWPLSLTRYTAAWKSHWMALCSIPCKYNGRRKARAEWTHVLPHAPECYVILNFLFRLGPSGLCSATHSKEQVPCACAGLCV